MPEFQIPLGLFSESYYHLTQEEKASLGYFTGIGLWCIESVMSTRYSFGPKGYRSPLILFRILKVKERISSDREFASKLRKNEIYRVVCQLSDGNTVPSRNTYTTLRSKLGIQGYTALHTNFVKEADKCGLLTPPLHGCPKTMRRGIVLVADSTFILTASFTQGMKAKDGTWLFTDRDAAFGRGHHKHKCPVGYKAHSLITINGIPLVSIMASANEHDTDYIIPLFERLCVRYPSFTFAYLILDKGYDSEAIHCAVDEGFGNIPVIIRKKMASHRGFIKDEFPSVLSESL